MTVTMDDVRRTLWLAYKALEEKEGRIDGKISEGSCELMYPAIWDCESLNEFLEPVGIEVYSYALGPSRSHFFLKGDVDKQENYYTWISPDFYAKAEEVINEWWNEAVREEEGGDA